VNSTPAGCCWGGQAWSNRGRRLARRATAEGGARRPGRPSVPAAVRWHRLDRGQGVGDVVVVAAGHGGRDPVDINDDVLLVSCLARVYWWASRTCVDGDFSDTGKETIRPLSISLVRGRSAWRPSPKATLFVSFSCTCMGEEWRVWVHVGACDDAAPGLSGCPVARPAARSPAVGRTAVRRWGATGGRGPALPRSPRGSHRGRCCRCRGILPALLTTAETGEPGVLNRAPAGGSRA
jgi:hypothetical protein